MTPYHSETKRCFKCEKVKLRTEFYKHSRMSDGLLGKCKVCTKQDVRNHRAANLDRIRDYDRRRGRTEKKREANRRANRRALARDPEAFRARTRAASRRWYEANRIKKRCHNAVNNALRDGRLVKGPCEVCGATKAEGHHDDYSRPLDVRWLCARHHAEHHNAERDAKREKPV